MDQEDRDRLIKIETDVSWVRSILDKHISDHVKIKILCVGALLSAGVALLVALI